MIPREQRQTMSIATRHANAPARAPGPNAATAADVAARDDVGFLLAKATQRWNELLAERFAAAGYTEVRPSYGSALLPLYEDDGLRMGELARRARLSKQTMTEMIRRLERDGLVERRPDPTDARASLIFLTDRSRRFEPVAAATLTELDRLVRRRLSAQRLAELKSSLRDLMEI
jgi:DNA-binding MarR family transcriptional regulator